MNTHLVSVLADVVTCPCGFRVAAPDADYARRVAHAHVANPSLGVGAVAHFLEGAGVEAATS